MIETGVGYRQELSLWIDGRPPHIDFLEILAEDFMRPELQNRLAALATAHPLAIRSRDLSLGTPGPLDSDRLNRLAALAAIADPLWISERIAFSRTGEVDLACAAPVRPDEDTVGRMAEHAREVADCCGVPLLLETVASHLRVPGPMSETEFLNRLCGASGCGLLLDVTALFVNSRNHRFDPHPWLREIDPAHIGQIHVSGFSRSGVFWEDRHGERVQREVWALAEAALAHAPVRGAILEYDIAFPAVQAIEIELRVLKAAGSRAA